MSRKENCILTNMCMICDGDHVLVQNRVDPEWPGITFPGGHVEPGESIVQSVIREVKEETGLDIKNVHLCGLKQWTAEDGSYRYIIFFFKTDTFSGTLKSSDEGEVYWMDRKEVRKSALANTFEVSLDNFESDEISETYYTFADGKWNVKNL